MGVLFSGVFWGLFLLLLGTAVLIKVFFHVDIPVFRTFFGLFLIFLGVKVLLGRSIWEGKEEAWFGSSRITAPSAGSKYDVVFGKGVLDLEKMAWAGSDAVLEANTVFGQTSIRLNAKIPTLVKASAAFSGANFPDGNLISFGEYAYKSKAYKEGKPCLTVKASVVFGNLEVKE